jgi:hypothetical protein
MKSKRLDHPRLYLKIIDKNNNDIVVEYKDNIFNEKGLRKHKKCKINLSNYSNILFDDLNNILDKLNKEEFKKINNYIKTQYKILNYHTKNKNHDSVKTVQNSIHLMESFKMEFNPSEF